MLTKKVNNQIGRSKEDKVSKKHDRHKWIKINLME
jgi:hypothetical protein